MEMSSNGEGSSKDIRQASNLRPASSHSDPSKATKIILGTDGEGYHDLVLSDFAGSEVPRGFSDPTAFISSDSEPRKLREFKVLNFGDLLHSQASLVGLKENRNLPEQRGRNNTWLAKSHEAGNALLGDDISEERIQDLLAEYDSARRCLFATIESTAHDPAILARRARIQNGRPPSNPPDDQVLSNMYGSIVPGYPDRTRPGTESGPNLSGPSYDGQEVADAPDGERAPVELEGQTRVLIPLRLRIWVVIKNETKKFGDAAFIVIGISLYSLNISSALGHLVVVNTPGVAAPTQDNSLKACLITWALTLKILVVYEMFYGNYRRHNGLMKYLLFLVLLSAGLCFAITFALHVLGANVISGVLIALSLSVVFIRIWAD